MTFNDDYDRLKQVVVTRRQPFSDAEAQAILYHDGLYINDNQGMKHREEPLTLLAHWADYWTAHIFEEGRTLTDDNDYYEKGN